jgi:hypothetical protein
MSNESMDRKARYVPQEMMTLKGMRPVLSYRTYPPHAHPDKCPLIDGCVALECVTADGSRWFGVDAAWINSELRMVISGTNPRDEVRMKWMECTTS